MAKSKMKRIVIQTEGKKVIALYVRVSTDKQREEGYSIDIQIERLTAYVKSMFPESDGEVEYILYVDDGYTGATLDRPKMNELIQDVKDGRITHVIVMKLDRLSRSQKDTLYLIEDVFMPHNVAFISMSESFNTDSPFGRAVLGILSVFAQFERENIYDRTRGGMRKRVESGLWPGGGRVPFGYDYDASQGILVPNKDADTVRTMYDLYIQGYALQTIANMCGLKYEKLAQQIITRKSNTGVIVYNGEEFQGQHEPIVSLETYHKAMAVMAERSAKRFVSATDHLLTGLVYCGECGAKMRYQKWGKAGDKFVCYSQQTSKPYLIKDPTCDNQRPWADEVEAIVLDVVFRRAKEKIHDDNSRVQHQSIADLLETQRAELSKKLKRLYDLYAMADDYVLLDSINELKKELAQIEQKLSMETERMAISLNAMDTQSKMDTLQECWPVMTIQEKQNIMRDVINRVTITGDHVHVDFKY